LRPLWQPCRLQCAWCGQRLVLVSPSLEAAWCQIWTELVHHDAHRSYQRC
jgi:hypothetical protein